MLVDITDKSCARPTWVLVVSSPSLPSQCGVASDKIQEMNRSFVLRAVKDVVFEDRAVPPLKDPWDVRVHVAQTGICGSDVHYWQRGRIGGTYINRDVGDLEATNVEQMYRFHPQLAYRSGT